MGCGDFHFLNITWGLGEKREGLELQHYSLFIVGLEIIIINKQCLQ